MMKYWFYKEELCYEDLQFPLIIDQTRLDYKTPISDEMWDNLRTQAETLGVPIINNPETNMPMLGQAYHPSETETLTQERDELKAWIESQAYIVTLIGAGVATAEEYRNELEEMKQKKERIKAIDERLAEINI